MGVGGGGGRWRLSEGKVGKRIRRQCTLAERLEKVGTVYTKIVYIQT